MKIPQDSFIRLFSFFIYTLKLPSKKVHSKRLPATRDASLLIEADEVAFSVDENQRKTVEKYF